MPGAPNGYVWVHNNEAPEGSNVDAGFALGLDQMAGQQEPISWGVFPLMGKDALYVRWNGGGGYGDPLERDAEAVLSDCRAGYRVARGRARLSMAWSPRTISSAVDMAATDRARRALAAARGAQEGRRMSRRVSPTLEIRATAQGDRVCCSKCGAALVPAGQPWKTAAALDESPMKGSGRRGLQRLRQGAAAPIHLQGLRHAARHRDGAAGRAVPQRRRQRIGRP